MIGFPPDNFNLFFFFLNALKHTLHTKNYCFRHWKMCLFNRKNMQQETNWKHAGTLQYFPSMFWYAGTFKKLFFPSLVAFKQPLFFSGVAWCEVEAWVQVRLIFTAWANAQIWKCTRKQHAARMIATAAAVFNIIDLEIWFFFSHQDKERIVYEQKIFWMEKINIF